MRNNDALVGRAGQQVTLHELVRLQTDPFQRANRGRIHLDGPHLHLAPDAVQTLGMAFHELATSATKHGALSVEGGRVDITWRFVADDGARFTIAWIERDGPEVRQLARSDFGQNVLREMTENALRVQVALDNEPAGLQWRLTCSSDCVLAGPSQL